MTREQELIRLFGSRATELEALRSLMGGTSMTHLRAARITESVFQALLQGLRDPNPRIRWWCVQLLDHSSDPRGITAVASMLDDPVPRVRQNAVHALGCLACKPGLVWRTVGYHAGQTQPACRQRRTCKGAETRELGAGGSAGSERGVNPTEPLRGDTGRSSTVGGPTEEVTIRPERPLDHDAIADVVAAAFRISGRSPA